MEVRRAELEQLLQSRREFSEWIIGRGRSWLGTSYTKVSFGDEAPARTQDRAVNDGLELPDIPRVVIAEQRGLRFMVECSGAEPDLVQVGLQEMPGQRQDVLGAFTQRRHFDAVH